MESGVEVSAPCERVGFGEGGGGHYVEGLAEVGRVLPEMHEGAIEDEEGLVWMSAEIQGRDKIECRESGREV